MNKNMLSEDTLAILRDSLKLNFWKQLSCQKIKQIILVAP